MEKLQAAIEQARKLRQEKGGSPEPDERASADNRQGRDAVSDPWSALKRLDLGDDKLIKRRVVTRQARQSATPFDILRTKALLQMRKNGWKRLAITSPMPQSGKTTLACNLALALSRQSDIRSMLFDFDLRDPNVATYFSTNPQNGIGDVMRGLVPFEEQALRYRDNLIVSMALSKEIDPTRILLSEETAHKLDEIQARYEPDVVIYDLPSVLVNDDTRAFLKNADCALIVARANSTQYGQFEICKREVSEQTNLLGVVLNAYRHDKRAFKTA